MEGNRRNIALIVIIITLLAVGAFMYKRPSGETVVPENPESPGNVPENGVDVVYKTDNLALPSWAPKGVQANPWEGSIYLARSDDGESSTGERFFIQHAGVPNLLLTQDNLIVATFQYFSYTDQTMFDRIAYTVSEDFGDTWSQVKLIKLGERYTKGSTPVDPTLVQLENGRYRLYFTFQEPGTQYPSLYSSISTSLDGVFVDEGLQLSTNSMLLDPAVVYFDGQWHITR